MTRVLIADDHTMVREGLRWALEHAGMTVVAEASDGQQAVHLAEEHHPDVVLMDLSLPALSGLAATTRIRATVPRTAVLVLSMLSDETAVGSALAAGARGYLVKDCTTTEIVDAVQRVAAGGQVLGAGVDAAALDAGAGSRPPVAAPAVEGRPVLSKREEEVLRLMATGVTIAEASRRLFISVKTLKNHLSSIYRKLDSHDRAQAVLKAMRMGLITLE